MVVEFEWKKKVKRETSPSSSQAVLGLFYGIGIWTGMAASIGGLAALPYAILAFVAFYLIGWVVAIIEWVIQANRAHKESLQPI